MKRVSIITAVNAADLVNAMSTVQWSVCSDHEESVGRVSSELNAVSSVNTAQEWSVCECQ